MAVLSRSMAVLSTVTIAIGSALAGESLKLDGRWDATLTQNGVVIPFRLDISGDGNKVVGTLYNGKEPKTTTSGVLKDGNLELNFEHYLTSIKATVKDGDLDGSLVSHRPATFFIGKDGKVKAIHSGFAAPASGVYHEELKREFTSIIDRLVKQKVELQSKDQAPVKIAAAN